MSGETYSDSGPSWSYDRGTKFLLFGDSLTQRSFEKGGWGSSLARHYCRKADVICRGFGGYNSRWGLLMLDKILAEAEYLHGVGGTISEKGAEDRNFVFVVWFGANDSLLGSSGGKQFVPLSEYQSNLNSIVESARKRIQKGLKIILVSPPPISVTGRIEHQQRTYGENCFGTPMRANKNTELYAKVVKHVVEINKKSCGDGDIYFLDVFDSMKSVENWENDMFCDGLHFSEKGQSFIFDRLLALINEEISEVSYENLKNHMPWHTQVNVTGDIPFGHQFNAEKHMPLKILKNCSVWDWEKKDFVKSSVAIQNRKFVRVPPQIEVDGTNCDIVDMEEKYLLPGLVDAHVHVYLLGESRSNVNLENCRSIEQFKLILKGCASAENNANKQWIIGGGWDHEMLGCLPTRQDIDEVISDRPVFLWRTCMHIGVANTIALKMCNITLNSPPKVPGGAFDVSNEDGHVTGIVREYAVQVIFSNVSEKSKEVKKKLILDGLKECRDSGLTAVQTNDEFCFDVYRELEDEGRLPLRVHLTSSYKEIGSRKPYEGKSGMLTNKRIKIFSDGSLGAGTAAIRKENEEGYSGMLMHSQGELQQYMKNAKENGYQIETHCIGDAAAAETLNALEAVKVNRSDRAILTHCQVLGEDLVRKMAEIGAIADIQPSFVPTDFQWIKKRLPETRLRWSYCWKTLIQNGVQVAGSSDAPIESCSPLKGMYDAIYRPTSHDTSGGSKDPCFLEGERLRFWEALSLYTVGANYASFTESKRGRIEPGFDADFVVVDRDVANNPELLKSAIISQVWVNGNATVLSKPTEGRQSSPYLPGKNGPKVFFRHCC